MAAVKGLRERLRDGDSIICAEGYMWELERRGYVKSGAFTPEVVLEHPEQIRSLHEEFVHAGSDVVEAFTYYAHQQRLEKVGRQDDTEQLNRTALRVAREVASRTGTLMAGSLCNSSVYHPDQPDVLRSIREMFAVQVQWAVEEGADYLIGETFNDFGEAKLALEVMKEHGNGLATVITIAPYVPDMTSDDVPIPQALRQLEEMGADVVGLNCGRGPSTMLPLLRQCRQVCKGPLAALPVPYRTTDKQRTLQAVTDPVTGEQAYPLNLAPLQCTRKEIRAFAEEARQIGIRYIGLCCGNSSACLRELAEAYEKKPPSCKYAPDTSLSFIVGNIENLPERAKMIKKHFSGLK
ncbi:betaine--homocysteine S-methyltransferase 1-like [Babylonia areolata]|uniref:betaine--homocysteine S-methyltransferase 1-like n=1 Tax=Babylonia areolata TaxID=304850 RepID=UPI003FD1C977